MKVRAQGDFQLELKVLIPTNGQSLIQMLTGAFKEIRGAAIVLFNCGILGKWPFYDKFKCINTSNGGCRREEKSRKHWSLFTKLLSSITAIFFYLLDQIKSNCLY